MVAIIGLVFFALVLCILLFVLGTVKPHVAAPQLRKTDTPEDSRAAGLN